MIEVGRPRELSAKNYTNKMTEAEKTTTSGHSYIYHEICDYLKRCSLGCLLVVVFSASIILNVRVSFGTSIPTSFHN